MWKKVLNNIKYSKPSADCSVWTFVYTATKKLVKTILKIKYFVSEQNDTECEK